MAMTEYSGDTAVIANIGTTPDERGLTTDEFKAKFDKGLQDFVTWFNTTHKTEFEAITHNITISTSDPSGGADGDIWLKYTP